MASSLYLSLAQAVFGRRGHDFGKSLAERCKQRSRVGCEAETHGLQQQGVGHREAMHEGVGDDSPARKLEHRPRYAPKQQCILHSIGRAPSFELAQAAQGFPGICCIALHHERVLHGVDWRRHRSACIHRTHPAVPRRRGRSVGALEDHLGVRGARRLDVKRAQQSTLAVQDDNRRAKVAPQKLQDRTVCGSYRIQIRPADGSVPRVDQSQDAHRKLLDGLELDEQIGARLRERVRFLAVDRQE